MAPDISMPGMEMPSAEMASPSDAAAYLASAFVMWFLMMIAMMLPSATPMIMLYGGLARGARDGQAVLAPTSIFAGAYLTIWGGFSALAAFAQWLLVRSGAVSEINLAFGLSTLAPLRVLRARTSEPAWARRVVDEGVRSCPRAGCGRSARPVVCPAKAGMFSRKKACRGKS